MIEAVAVLLFRLATLAIPAPLRRAWGEDMQAAFLSAYRRRPGLRFTLRASADAVRAGRVRSGTYVYFPAMPALRFAYMPGTAR